MPVVFAGVSVAVVPEPSAPCSSEATKYDSSDEIDETNRYMGLQRRIQACKKKKRFGDDDLDFDISSDDDEFEGEQYCFIQQPKRARVGEGFGFVPVTSTPVSVTIVCVAKISIRISSVALNAPVIVSLPQTTMTPSEVVSLFVDSTMMATNGVPVTMPLVSTSFSISSTGNDFPPPYTYDVP